MTDTSFKVRLPEETRKKMRELNINWSDYIRQVVEEKISEMKRKKATESMNMIRGKTKHGTFDSKRSIREDRNGGKARAA